MQIILSSIEREYLVIKDFKMTIKSNCPDSIAKTLNEKIKQIEKYDFRKRP